MASTTSTQRPDTQPGQSLTVAITGASGLVGSALSKELSNQGHTVLRLVRKPPQSGDEIYWDPSSGAIDANALEGVDAVVNLAGVSIAGGLWTSGRKEAILRSRVDGTRLLSETLAGLDRPPQVLVSTSAVGYYGDGGDGILTEESPSGTGFLSDVCRAWEDAATPARESGIRVVHPRFGVVFAQEGGILPLIALPFKFGVGGNIGSGNQYMSWIAIDDLVAILIETITNNSLRGAVNAVSPNPVTNAAFTRALGATLHRPTFMKVPAKIARIVGGDLARELILVSQRAVPEKLQDAGFSFTYPNVEDALSRSLGKEA